ncbi:transposable element P transposase isoform X1 [Paramuricea clavata]|uniref:Transposable element P transposase isoform X1 n=1 Tax=Paramuricea clavata TaxID=317549 RepID=A0A6S7GZ05_PARCT|nr:transposable element P transposase isoform X1 [Paramuricea clavata]
MSQSKKRKLKPGGTRVHCSACNCSNSKGSHPNLSFFRFPSDTKRSKEWVVACRREDLLNKTPKYLYANCKLCSEHFEDCMFVNPTIKNRLNDKAKPSIFNVQNPPPSLGCKRRIITRNNEALPSSGKRARKEKDTCPTQSNDLQVDEVQGENEDLIRENIDETHANVINPETEDGTCQTSPDITSDTPRKKKLKQTIKSKNDQIKKLKKKLNPKKRLNPKRKSKRERTIDQALSQLPPNMANFIRDQISLHSKKSKGRRYSPEMKTIALSLYHASGKAYKILSKLFILPSKSSLKRFISNIPTTSGISEQILKAIQQKVLHMNDMEKICTLCIDEISLKSHLYYSVPDDKIIGLEDFGNGVRSKKIATSALALLIRSIS